MTDLTWVRGGAIALGLAAVRRRDDLDDAIERMAESRIAADRAIADERPQSEVAAAVREHDRVRAEAATALVISHRAEVLANIMSDFAGRAMGGTVEPEAISEVATHVRALVGEGLVLGALEGITKSEAKSILAERAA